MLLQAQQQFNLENWNHVQYHCGELNCLITYGAEPGLLAEVREIFYVTVVNSDFADVFQKKFPALEMAISYINGKYGDWEFQDRIKLQSEAGGCGTCSNHN